MADAVRDVASWLGYDSLIRYLEELPILEHKIFDRATY